jgi:hypothetical protein
VAVRTAGTMARSRTALITPLVTTRRPAAVTLAVPLALRPGPVLPRGPGPVTGSTVRRCPRGAPSGAARGVPVGRPGRAAGGGPITAAELTRGRGPARAVELATGRGPLAATPNIVIGRGTRGVPAGAGPAGSRACSPRARVRRTRRPACPVTIARSRAAARLVARRRAASVAGPARSFGGRCAAEPPRPVGRRNPRRPRRRSR